MFILVTAAPAGAEGLTPSLSDWGGAGLLQTPTARFLPDGTVTAGYTALGTAHRHLFTGAQLLPWLEVGVRESLFPSLYGVTEPGLDAKLRLVKEGPRTPEIALGGRDLAGAGFQAPGRGRFAGEYLILSRRWWNLDTSLGMGWGRLGGYGHLRNPLRFLGARFRRDRDPALPASRGPRSWFTGDRVALFGGVEWHTPLPGLSTKIEYSGDSFRSEQQDDPLFRPGLPVNAGVAWRPLPWVELGAGLEQGHRLMARLAVRLGPADLGEEAPSPPSPVGPRPSREAALSAQELAMVARATGLPARAAALDGDRAVIWLDPAGSGTAPLAREAGRAVRLLADSAPPEAERLVVVTGAGGLEATTVTLQRGEVARAANGRGSAEEVWRTARIEPVPVNPPDWIMRWDLALRPTLESSLFELSAPLVQRSYTDLDLSVEPWRGVLLGTGIRLNLGDNLPWLDTNALPAEAPVRSDLPLYALPRANLDHLYGAWRLSPTRDWHAGVTAGHFEEMFGGAGVELLHRPVQARWAAGLDINHVWKRPPGDPLHLLQGSGRMTGHANLHLEAPGGTATGSLRLGRYLGGDWGGTLELARRFEGGLRLSAHVTWTEGPRDGQSRIGGRLEQGVVLSIPLGASGVLPMGGSVETAIRTLGRDAGQRLRRPFPLYETMAPAGFGSLAGGWNRLLD
nr:YjbH domain-containing protein [Azospirillum sp. SYSU D00513]